MQNNRSEKRPNLPRVFVIATGGTIASGDGDSVTLDAKGLIERLPALKGKVDIEQEDFVQIPSSSMTPEIQFKLAQHTKELLLNRKDLAGIVVTHGTDSLEETAFMLDLLIDDPRLVIFTTAQRTPDVSDSDGPRNLEYAILTAISLGALDMGVLVVLNETIHSARFVKKTHTSSVEAFSSGKKGMLGTVDNGTVIFYNVPLNRLTLPTATIESQVDLIRLSVGDTGKFIKCATQSKSAGLVIESFGRGNMSPIIIDVVLEAHRAGLIVVITSRSEEGRVAIPDKLKKIGIIAGEDLDGIILNGLVA